jgi:hypothetical protein
LTLPILSVESEESWTWSTELEQGNSYTWIVKKLKVDNQVVTEAVASTSHLREGSLIKIDLLQIPSELNWLNASLEEMESYFNDTIDGTHYSELNTNLFIYPINFHFGNGTVLNVFEEAAREKGFFYFHLGAKNIEIQNNILSQTLYGENRDFEIFAEVKTGLLNLYHVTQKTQGFEILIERNFIESDGTLDYLLGLIIVSGVLILIIIIQTLRFTRKSTS